MNFAKLTVIAAGMTLMPLSAIADDHKKDEHDYSTVNRVHYVQECMAANGHMNVYEATHKCSCVIDKIAEDFTQTEFEDLSTAYKYKNMPADKGAQFRDHKGLSADMDKYEKTVVDAYRTCRITR